VFDEAYHNVSNPFGDPNTCVIDARWMHQYVALVGRQRPIDRSYEGTPSLIIRAVVGEGDVEGDVRAILMELQPSLTLHGVLDDEEIPEKQRSFVLVNVRSLLFMRARPPPPPPPPSDPVHVFEPFEHAPFQCVVPQLGNRLDGERRQVRRWVRPVPPLHPAPSLRSGLLGSEFDGLALFFAQEVLCADLGDGVIGEHDHAHTAHHNGQEDRNRA